MPFSLVAGSMSLFLMFAGLDADTSLEGGVVQNARKIWVGRSAKANVDEIALRVAPILWFTADEPHVLEGMSTPAALPCERDGNGHTVYYRRIDANADAKWVTLEYPDLELEYYFYYFRDYGIGCHSNDLESARLTLRLTPLDSEDDEPLFAVALTSIVGAAHGSPWFENRLDLTQLDVDDVSLPPTLLVEEGKHAVAPDRNADGWYTPGYDVNQRPNDAWGIRDVAGSGYVWGSEYQAHMTKPRHGGGRIMVDAKARRGVLWSKSYRATWAPLPTRTYRLVRLPEACKRYRDPEPPKHWAACKRRTVSEFLQEKGIQERTGWNRIRRGLKELGDGFGLWFVPGTEGMGKTVGLRATPFVIPTGPGWITTELTFYFGSLVEDEDSFRTKEAPSTYFRPEFDMGFYYKPSMSRAVEWYGGVGFFAPGLRELTEEEYAVLQIARSADISEREKVPGNVTEAFVEVGLEVRWSSRVTLGPGLRYYGERGFSPVFRLGFSIDRLLE